MLRIAQLKLRPNHSEEELYQKVAKELSVPRAAITELTIIRQSIDARKKPEIFFVYTVDVCVRNEKNILRKVKTNHVTLIAKQEYQFPSLGDKPLKHPPVIVGMGPAGLFCAYLLAKHGFCPIVIERGKDVDKRVEDVEVFWQTGDLNLNSNVQFGEGGAGTFSDGKLNTTIKDKDGRNRKILEILVENGAPQEILFLSKPHIGTDILVSVVKNMRNKILEWGGTVCFETQFVDYDAKNNHINRVQVLTPDGMHYIDTEVLILAIGHSARDTFEQLYKNGLEMQAKSFAVGVRVEHLQSLINESQYGKDCVYNLPAAPYKLTANLENGRGVYSFCMCPGGYVVNASSEHEMLAINGMSYYARDGENANSAIIVTISPEDYEADTPLAGMYFQRTLERRAYRAGAGMIPIQRFDDFCNNKQSETLGRVKPQVKGTWVFGDVRSIFPAFIQDALIQGITLFDRQIKGYADGDTLLLGVESRTSSPIRILRDEMLQSSVSGIYPCGEGAGYAGGITSAAADGMKVAEKVASCHYLFTKK